MKMTPEQRRQVLEYVRDNSPTGEAFELPEVQFRFGLDIGYALVVLACEDLCGIEDPNICWSTEKGRAAAR